MDRIREMLESRGINISAAIKLSDSLIIKKHKILRAGFDEKSQLYAVVFAVPYLTDSGDKNLSAYAVPRDYHLFFKELFSSLIPTLKEEFSSYTFAGFADDSPIDERTAALIGGLGILGDNGLMITTKYSSFIFLGEIITDMPLDTVEYEIQKCEGCGKCAAACPKEECGDCLSALTQRKGELSEEEKQYVLKYGSVWGCDICQEVCPHTARAKKQGTIYTNIDFFKEKLTPILTSSTVDAMSDEDFSERAYSWRKRETIRRNLLLFEESSKK